MGSKTLKQDMSVETLKASPAVAGAAYSYLTLNEWVAIATFLYIIFQVIVLIHKHHWAMQDRRIKMEKMNKKDGCQ